MTRGVLGVAALNVLFLLAGAGLLWGIRGWRTWTELLRLAGFAHMLGVAAVGVIATEVLSFGGSLRPWVVLAVAFATAASGLVLGLLRRRPRPVWRLAGDRREPLLLVGVAAAALVLLVLAAALRAGYRQGLVAYDAWAFWTPKAQTIYYFDGLDEQLFAAIPGPGYPVFIPAFQALGFSLMGSPDTVALHTQYWFLLAGFVFALAGILRPYVPIGLLWPFLALMVVMPYFEERMLSPLADLPLDYFFALASACVAVWLIRREAWLLASSGVFLAAGMSAKREGHLLAVVLLVAALVVTWRDRRFSWWRLVATGALAFAFTLPFRFWRARYGIGGELEEASLSGMLHNLDRIPPGFALAIELLFDYRLWLLAAPLGVAAGVVLLLRRRDRIAALYLSTMGLGVLGMTWISWAFTRLPIEDSDQTPVPRVVGALVLLSIALAPLMLARAREADSDPELSSA